MLGTIDGIVNDATKRQWTIRLVILQHYVTAQKLFLYSNLQTLLQYSIHVF